MLLEAYFDGCCEPKNPGGTASYGAIILQNDEKLWACSELFRPAPGKEHQTSNNIAEYAGFLAILNYLIAHQLTRIPTTIYGDSKLVIEQQFGTWKMRKGFYIPLANKAKKLIAAHFDLGLLAGAWIPREENGLADELSKAELIKAGVPFRIQPLSDAERVKICSTQRILHHTNSPSKVGSEGRPTTSEAGRVLTKRPAEGDPPGGNRVSVEGETP